MVITHPELFELDGDRLYEALPERFGTLLVTRAIKRELDGADIDEA